MASKISLKKRNEPFKILRAKNKMCLLTYVPLFVSSEYVYWYYFPPFCDALVTLYLLLYRVLKFCAGHTLLEPCVNRQAPLLVRERERETIESFVLTAKDWKKRRSSFLGPMHWAGRQPIFLNFRNSLLRGTTLRMCLVPNIIKQNYWWRLKRTIKPWSLHVIHLSPDFRYTGCCVTIQVNKSLHQLF